MFKVTFKAPVTWLQPLCPAIPTIHTSSVDIYTLTTLGFLLFFFFFFSSSYSPFIAYATLFQILLYPANCYTTFRFQFKCTLKKLSSSILWPPIVHTLHLTPTHYSQLVYPGPLIFWDLPLFYLNNSFNNWNSFFFLQYKPMKSKAETVSITDLLKPSQRVGRIESSTETYVLPCVKLDSWWRFPVWRKEFKSNALWQLGRVGWSGRWKRGSRGRGHVYTYSWFMMIYGRNQHSIVKQLFSN